MPAQTGKPELSWERVRNLVANRLGSNLPIDVRLPGGGRLRIERQLPFLLVYRIPAHPDPGTADLVTTESAYLIAPGVAAASGEVEHLCRTILGILRTHFGIVVLMEIWSGDCISGEHHPLSLAPAFEIVTHLAEDAPHTVTAIRNSLERIALGGEPATVHVTARTSIAPPGQPPLATSILPSASDPIPDALCIHVGLVVRPVYQCARAGGLYPLILQRLRRRLSSALRESVFHVTDMGTQQPQLHADSLGPSRLGKTADRVDRQLSRIASSFDFLLQVSPANSEQAWHDFQRSGCRTLPRLYYRPLPYRPSLLKRKLFSIPVERVEDPTLAWLFSQKQVELDRELSALRDIGTPLFRYSSLQLFGRPDRELLQLAESILRTPARPSEIATDESGRLSAAAMALRARFEIDAYRREQPAFEAHIELSEGIAAGIMVSGHRLLISTSLRVDPQRVAALLQHEIGTHLLTHFNGRSQSLRLLAHGLARCDDLQEGLAILAEHLSGGLSTQRLRVLAARVLAVEGMLNEAPFEDTFHRLVETFGIPPRSAFTTALRAYRGGGLTKDVLYLRGLQRLLIYLGKGQALEPLYVGKIALQHVPLMRELRNRGIVRAPLLLPRFWNSETFRQRLDDCRGQSVVDLLRESLHASNASNTGEVA